MMPPRAFETWKTMRVCLRTDARSERSRTAVLALGTEFEGILRSRRLAVDPTPRDSARYAILREVWPELSATPRRRLGRGRMTA